MSPSRELIRLSNRLQPVLRRRLLEAARTAQTRLPIGLLAEILRSRRLDAAELRRLLAEWPALVRQAVLPTLTRAARGGAAIAHEDLTDRLGVGGFVPIVNPAAVRAAERQTARLVTRITGETRTQIRLVVRLAMAEGLPPREAARLIQPLVGLTARQSASVFRFRERLLAAGAPEATLFSQLGRYERRLLRQRAVNIARTEIQFAQEAGQTALCADGRPARPRARRGNAGVDRDA